MKDSLSTRELDRKVAHTHALRRTCTVRGNVLVLHLSESPTILHAVAETPFLRVWVGARRLWIACCVNCAGQRWVRLKWLFFVEGTVALWSSSVVGLLFGMHLLAITFRV